MSSKIFDRPLNFTSKVHDQKFVCLDQTSITAQLFRVIEFKLSMDFQIISIAYQLAFGAFEQSSTSWWLKRYWRSIESSNSITLKSWSEMEVWLKTYWSLVEKSNKDWNFSLNGNLDFYLLYSKCPLGDFWHHIAYTFETILYLPIIFIVP